MTVEIPTQLTDDTFLPHYNTEDASGADVRAAIAEPLALKKGERALIPTGIKVAIPSGYEIQVRPRSGLALKKGITVLNTPGTIDADYRGEVCVILINLSDDVFVVEPGSRIAQLVVTPVLQANFIEVTSLATTARGAGGFGHTGTQ